MTRIEKIRSGFSSRADAFFIKCDSNRFYASGFSSSDGFILLSGHKAILYVDSRYYEMAKVAQSRGELQREIEVELFSGRRFDIIRGFILDYGVKSLMFEDMHTSVLEYNLLREAIGECSLVASGDTIERVRAVKDEEELSRIKSAQKITDAAFTHILPYINTDVTEAELALELEYFIRKSGADGLAFDTICVSGKKSSMPHGTPANVKISKGFLTMDFGAKFGGYCSDMTRTVCVGEPTCEMRCVYDTVLSAQKLALEKIHAGLSGCEIDGFARDFIYECGYKGCFGHSLGHSLGIDIHESPNFSPNFSGIIPENAVISVEPGIYIEGKFGVRIEDIVKISQMGCENLTESTKELIII